jgi:preprotein translocase subunit SecA
MRIFGGDRIKSIMTTFKVQDDEPISSGIISSAIESAQSKIEGFNFDARHHLLEYDDVMNKHREIIYKKRREVFAKPELEDHKKFISLKVIDTLWQDHLSNMEYLRDSVRLQAYANKDPLVEYKNQGRKLFSQLLQEIDFEIADNVLKASLQKSEIRNTKSETIINSKNLNSQNIGRNDLCPCGSGKKYKRCHGR